MSFFRHFLLSVLGFLALYFAVVGTVNPRDEFWGHWFKPEVVNIRTIKRDQYRRQLAAHPVTGVVLGSSRVMSLDPTVLGTATGERFFNFGAFAATIEDIAVLGRTVRRDNPHLKTLIIGLDERMLRSGPLNTEFDRTWWLWRELHPTRAVPLFRAFHGARELKRALTVEYVQGVGRALEHAIAPVPPRFGYREDGLLEYVRDDAAIAAGSFDLDAVLRACIPGFVARFVQPHPLDASRVRLARQFFSWAKDAGLTLTVFRPPLNPALVASLRSHPPAWSHLQQEVSAIGRVVRASGLRWLDFGNVDSFGGGTRDWYDCVHYRSATARRLVTALARSDDWSSPE